MARWAAVAAGVVLIAIAFTAAAQVADTREGLIAEVVTLIAGLAGVGLLLYGLVPRRRPPSGPEALAERPRIQPGPRSVNDLLVGAGGLTLAAVLLTGLLISGGWQWTLVGAVLLLPLILGCAYLCAAFVRARDRDWTIDLRRLIGHR